MNSVFEYKYLDHEFVSRSTQRRSEVERRSGTEKRAGNPMVNEKLGDRVESSELVQPFDNSNFINEFGWF